MSSELPENPPPPLPIDANVRELFIFLRQESAAARDALRNDSDANRETLLGTLKIIYYPLTAVIVVATFLGWRSLKDLQASIQTEAQAETKIEVTRMQDEIRKRLSEQFQTPNLQAMVQEAARTQTQTALRPLISNEVRDQVGASVAKEQQTIRTSLLVETHKAVDNLKPTIDAAVAGRVNSSVDSAVSNKIQLEVRPVLTQLQANERLSSLFILAQSGDATAFDTLLSMTSDMSLSNATRNTIVTNLRNVIALNNEPFYGTTNFKVPKTPAQLVEFLSSPDPLERKAATDTLPLDNIYLEKLVSLALADPDLSVRRAAYFKFNAVTHQSFKALDSDGLRLWWSQHSNEYAK